MNNRQYARIQMLAQRGRRGFTQATREDGSAYLRTTPDAPSWLQACVRAGHQAGNGYLSMPDDDIYEFVQQALDVLADNDSLDAAEDAIEPDCYTSNLTGWLHRDVNRLAYLDGALEVIGVRGDGFALLSDAQLLHRREVFQNVATFLDMLTASNDADNYDVDDEEN